MLTLIDRACRVRSYWIRISDDPYPGHRFILDEQWPDLLELLERHHLIRRGALAAAGPADVFIHIVNSKGILDGLWLLAEPEDEGIRNFRRALVNQLRKPRANE